MTSISFTAYPRNSDMEGRRELSEVLNWRGIGLEDLETCPTS